MTTLKSKRNVAYWVLFLFIILPIDIVVSSFAHQTGQYYTPNGIKANMAIRVLDKNQNCLDSYVAGNFTGGQFMEVRKSKWCDALIYRKNT